MTFELFNEDNLDVLRRMPDNSVDAVVTDPPYGLGKEPDALAMLRDWMEHGHHDVKNKKGFMGKTWDNFVPQPAQWKEVYRVLKPGGHVLAFAGTRTQDLMALGLRIAGFEIRDLVAWVYGAGFPKSLDVSKAIDKQGGGEGMPENDRKAFATELKEKREAAGVSRQDLASWFPQYLEVTKNWERQDVGFRVPSEPDYQILVDRLGVSESWRLRVRLEDKRRLISADLQDRRGDETVIGLGHSGKEWAATTDAAKQWDGWGTALKPALEPITLARKPLEGTVAGNVLKWHTGALNIDGCRVEHVTVDGGSLATNPHLRTHINGGNGGNIIAHEEERRVVTPDAKGRWPANVIHDGSDEVLALFPETTSGKPGIRRKPHQTGSMSGTLGMTGKTEAGIGDSGSAARFFYCAKTNSTDRNEGCEELPDKIWKGENTCIPERDNRPFNPSKNDHPTVKPTALMRYLCRLVTPPGGMVLDPWMGSGSTGKACAAEGFSFIGIDSDTEHGYFRIAEARVSAAFNEYQPEEWI